MKEIQDNISVVSGAQLGNLVGLVGTNQHLGNAFANYQSEVEEAKKQLDESLASGKLGEN